MPGGPIQVPPPPLTDPPRKTRSDSVAVTASIADSVLIGCAGLPEGVRAGA